ncbi:Disulfide-bond oxidoreductase YfcG [Hypsizygus marmoreus]|uniref:Disulfide-bond oxidoreductase YfcG n=1 Tax=Hypsizygus marmoreus TaxID=39966 RepID=A0A369JS89_HYPMA|nr:Disulfide-bond oxidoreductase YfcG [Hypsizygus marmoreus]
MSTSTKPFVVYFAVTPNGVQPTILLEELKAFYPAVDYDIEKIDISKDQNKEPWFIKLNPNGRIPVLVDRSRDNFPVFETAAILLYLAHNYDKDYHFWFDPVKEPKDYSEMLQWIFFAHGGIGPMQGQANHFGRFAPEDIPYAKNRYINETKRLYGVLEIRLADRDWLAGPGRGKYSIADIKAFPWVRIHKFAGVETLDEWPSVKAWVERNQARPAVEAGLAVGKSS